MDDKNALSYEELLTAEGVVIWIFWSCKRSGDYSDTCKPSDIGNNCSCGTVIKRLLESLQARMDCLFCEFPVAIL